MKKLMSVIGIILMVVSIAAVTVSAQERVTVTQWSFALMEEQGAEFGDIAERFEKANPGIKVNIEFFPWAYRVERMMTAVTAGKAPDLAYFNMDTYAPFADVGVLLALDEYIPQETMDDLKKIYRWKGKFYVMSILQNSMGWAYNKEIYRKAGLDPENPPLTWNEFFEACDRIKEIGIWPVTEGMVAYDPWLILNPWLYQAGGDYLNEEGTKVILGNKEGVEAMETILKLWDNYISPGDRALDDYTNLPQFGSGRAAMTMMQNQDIVMMYNDFPELDFGFGHTLEYRQRLATATEAGYGIFTQSKHPDEAVKWLLFLTNPENTASFCATLWFISPRKSVDSLVIEKINDPLYEQSLEEAPYSRMFMHPLNVTMYRHILPNVQAAILGQKTIERALGDMVEKCQLFLDEYNITHE